MEEGDNQNVFHALNLDVNSQKNFIKFFKSLGEKPATTVRFFERGEYYTCHGQDDSDLVSKITNGIVKNMSPTDKETLLYVTLSKSSFETAIRDILLVKNFRVEVYTSKGGQESWKLEYQGSPGNCSQFDDILFSNEEVNIGSSVIGVQIKTDGMSRRVGVACVEQNDCQISLMEFQDDDYFGELEAVTVLMGPKECILPSEEADFLKIKQLMERNRILVTSCKKNDFNIKNDDIVQDLNNVLRFKKGQIEDANSLPEMSLNIAVSALGAVMKYLKLTEDAGNVGNYEIKQMDFNRFVRLDAAAIAALNILPQPGSNPSSPAYHWQSVLGVLDYCCTPQGHRLMAQWIKQPLRNEATLKDRHDIVECLLDSRNSLNELHDDYLKRLPDIQMAARKLLRKKATLQDVFRIYQVIMRAPKIIKTLMELENSTINNVLVNPMKSTMEDLKGLKQMVEQVVDFETISKGEYLVKASFDDDLLEVKTKMDEIYAKMEKLLKRANDDIELDGKGTVKLEYISHLGYHFRITLKDEGSIRKDKRYKILDCVKGGVRFTNEKLQNYDEEFKVLKEKYVDQQQAIVNEVIRVAIGYIGTLNNLNKSVAEIDCLVSFAISAVSAPKTYVKPKMLPEGSGILELTNIRHPCLELQANTNFIANSVEFHKDETTMYIITGPNMGGKSTYIRSIGTAVLMAHVGAFVPCDKAIISMVDSIQGRVGASDNIIKGLSTFMVEMIETAGIIRSATEKSLVIIDELGRGTSTYEGCGIAWSIAEHLAKEIKCFTLFATHFHEITDISKDIPTVKNCHMAAVANQDDFVLLYEVKPGVTEKSFGIHVAKLAEFPNKTVKLATQFYGEFEDEHKLLKTEKDDELLKNLLEEIRLLCSSENIDINQIKLLKEKVQKEAKDLNSHYFKAAYPSLFEN
ncbi:DNA mismatch repair protein spellchecker 1 [Condylostylus longicornis]|uniref:DNA mismatch repair protein spellchecker 1 n=1 Tax=Condylostylus longicornis TaxID=2530218 RepID=UPI00244E41D4|nr:DNA mismatch repair protein spellchecker 1 [Condylostylus longicornis]